MRNVFDTKGMALHTKSIMSRTSLELLITAITALIVFPFYSRSPLFIGFGMIGILMVMPMLFKKPEYGLFLLVMIFPLRDFYVISAISLQRIVLWGFVVCAVIRQLMMPQSQSSRHFLFFNKAALCFIVALGVSLLKAASELYSTSYITMASLKSTIFSDALVVVENMLLFYIVYYFLETLEQVQRLLDLMMAVSIMISLLGIAQYYSNGAIRVINFLAVPDVVYYGRATSVFMSPNTLGHFEASILAMALVLLIWGPISKLKRFGFILPVIIVNSWGMVVTFSRSAILTFCLSIIVIAYLYYIKICKWKIRWESILLVVVLLGLIALMFNYYEVFLRARLAAYSEKDFYRIVQWIRTQSDFSRKYAMLQALRTFLEHPLFGIGYNVFSGKNIAFGLPAHSQYLKVLAEMGLFGFIPFMAMFGCILKTGMNLLHTWRGTSILTKHQFMALLLLTGFSTIALTSLSVDDLHIRAITGNFWIFSGAIFVLDRQKPIPE
jgi:O-antigen ligase